MKVQDCISAAGDTACDTGEAFFCRPNVRDARLSFGVLQSLISDEHVNQAIFAKRDPSSVQRDLTLD